MGNEAAQLNVLTHVPTSTLTLPFKSLHKRYLYLNGVGRAAGVSILSPPVVLVSSRLVLLVAPWEHYGSFLRNSQGSAYQRTVC